MTPLDVAFRRSARDDLASVQRWLLETSGDPVLAERYIMRITQACRRIGETPLIGRQRDDLISGLRMFPFERKAVIAYIVRDNRVEIVNVFFRGRDIEAFYGDRSETGRIPED